MTVEASQEICLHIEGHIVEGQTLDKEGHEVRVTIIQGGTSKNGYSYNEAALQAIARLVEGAHAYADHARNQSDSLTRSVRDVVGFYHDAQYIPADGASTSGRVDATLHIFEAADWLWSMIQEACTLGRPELIGLSIDIFGQWSTNATTKAKDVTHVVSLNSCDVVTRPSAGGAFRRILHDEGDSPVHPTTTPAAGSTPASPDGTRLSPAEQRLERRLQESILPAAVKEQVRTKFKGRIFEEAELETELISALTMMAQL